MAVDYKDLPFSDRPDLTPYLIHLTKNSRNTNGYSAFRNLVNILQTGIIWGSSKKGYIRGPNRASCFMDVPFISLKYVLTPENHNPEKPRYEPYGVFVTKKYGYNHGLRPVLYLSNKELKSLKIPENELWRVVRLEVFNNNKWISWLYEREWRCKGDFKLPRNSGVLVKNTKDLKKLQSMIECNPEKFKVKPRTIIPLEVICQGFIE